MHTYKKRYLIKVKKQLYMKSGKTKRNNNNNNKTKSDEVMISI